MALGVLESNMEENYTSTLTFCGKKNCCPEFINAGDKVALKDDYGNMALLRKDELLDMAKMFRAKTDEEILNSLGLT